MEGAADECTREDTVEGSGCFLGRPGLLFPPAATLSDVGTEFCCPRHLESPCKPGDIEMERGKVGGVEAQEEGCK